MDGSYRYDPVRRRYIGPDGKVVSRSVIRALRDTWADLQAEVMRGFADNVGSGLWSLAQFETAARLWLGETVAAGYQLGRGGSAMMTPDDAFELARLISEQARRLELLIADKQTGRLTPAQFGAYAEAHAGAAVQAFEVANADGLDLPTYPADGSQDCWYNCLPAGQMVTSPSVLAGYRRWFDGDMLTVRTASGREFAVTPNHPVLTDKGWVAAGELNQSHDLICGTLSDGLRGRDPHVYDEPTAIGQVFDAIAEVFVPERVMGVAVDFHGDGRQGEVDVIRTDGELRHRRNPPINEHLSQFSFTLCDGSTAALASIRSQLLGVVGIASATPGPLSSASEPLAFIGGQSPHPEIQSIADAANTDAVLDEQVSYRFARASISERQREFTLSSFVSSDDLSNRQGQIPARRLMSQRDATFPQSISNDAVSNAKLAAQLRNTLAGDVERDQVISVERDAFHGYVYNLETRTNWYLAGGAIIHNCRCYWSIEEFDDRYEATWITVGDEQVCPTCEANGEEYNPYVQVKGV